MEKTMPHIILATRNKGKIKELTSLLQNFGFIVLGVENFPQLGELPETGTTFEENALQKARAVAMATGYVAVADDSGLEVDALSGAPGVYSARFSGPGATDEKNNARLLKELEDVPLHSRSARFQCVIAACSPGGETLTATGIWEGSIATSLAGAQGFGYDPLFVDKETGQHAAQMTREEKARRSHRGKALQNFLKNWPQFWAKVR